MTKKALSKIYSCITRCISQMLLCNCTGVLNGFVRTKLNTNVHRVGLSYKISFCFNIRDFFLLSSKLQTEVAAWQPSYVAISCLSGCNGKFDSVLCL